MKLRAMFCNFFFFFFVGTLWVYLLPLVEMKLPSVIVIYIYQLCIPTVGGNMHANLTYCIRHM